MSNLKIPTHKFLFITNGPYKGYEADFRMRLHKGEFVELILHATGETIIVGVVNVKFITEHGSEFQYFPTSNGGFTLKELEKSNRKITYQLIEEENKGMSPVFLPDIAKLDIQSDSEVNSENDSDSGSESESDTDSDTSEKESRSEQKMVAGTFEQELIELEWISLGQDIMTKNLSELCQILEYSFTNT